MVSLDSTSFDTESERSLAERLASEATNLSLELEDQNHQQVFSQHLRSAALVAIFLVLLPSFALADNGDSAQAYRQGYNLVLDENWQGAIQAFETLIDQYPDSEWGSWWPPSLQLSPAMRRFALSYVAGTR